MLFGVIITFEGTVGKLHIVAIESPKLHAKGSSDFVAIDTANTKAGVGFWVVEIEAV